MRESEPATDTGQIESLPVSVSPKRRLPLQGLGRKEWFRLGLAALAAFYALYTVYWLAGVGLLRYMGGDFAGLWASAEIGQQLGYARIYDLEVQAEFQRALVAQSPAWLTGLAPTPPTVTGAVPYLPVVMVPFLPLLPLGPIAGYAAWTLINAVLLAAYLVRLVIALRSDGRRRVSLAVVALSWPVYMTFFFGQINVPLLVLTGEFVLSMAAGRSVLAGVCLGLLLAKPQLLILVIPGLLVARQARVLVSFALTALTLLGISAYLIGWPGLLDLAGIIGSFSGSLSTNAPEHMMNWRALGLAIAPLAEPAVINGLLVGGMVLCGMGALALWWRLDAHAGRPFAAALLAIFAATNVVTWHSHMQMAAVSIPVLIYAVTFGVVPVWLASLWLLGPAVVLALTLFTIGNPMTYAGLSLFGLNLVMEAWAVIVFLRARSSTVATPTVSLLKSPAAPAPLPEDEVS